MGGDYGIDQALADGPEALERTFLVSSHKPTVAGCIRREDRRQPSVWPIDRQSFLLDWLRPVYAFSSEGQGMMKMRWRGRPMSVLARLRRQTFRARGPLWIGKQTL
jgi:hypothetical protein